MAGNQVRLAESYLQVIPIVGQIGNQLAAQITQGVNSSQVSQATQNAGSEIGNQVGETAGQAAGDGMSKKMMAALAVAGAGAMVAAKVGEAVTVALERMDATAKVTAQLNLNPEEAKKLKDAADNIFTSGYGEDYATVNAGLKDLVGGVKGARNLTADELAAMGKDMTNLAETFEQDTGVMATAMQAMISNGMVKGPKEALETLAAAYTNLGPAGIEFSENMTEFSNDFSSLGFDGAETVGFVKSALEAGFKSSEILADSLNELQIKVGDGSADETLTALGMDPNTVRANFAAGGDAAQASLIEVMKKLQASGDRANWAGVFGTQAEDYFSNFQQMNLDSAPIYGNLAKLDTDLTTINTLVTSLQRTFENAFLEALTPILEDIAPKIKEFATYISENEDAAKALGIAVGVTLVGAIVLMTAALFALIIPVLANPLTWIIVAWIAGIALVAFAVWQLVANWETGMAAIADIWNSVMGFLADDTIITGMAYGFEETWKSVINGIISGLNWIIQKANSIKFTIPDWMGGGDFGGLNIPLIAPVPMKDGGYVKSTSTGTLALLAEAGKPEAVTGARQLNDNLDAQTALMNSMQTGKSVVINVYMQPGESAEEFAQRIKDIEEFNGTR